MHDTETVATDQVTESTPDQSISVDIYDQIYRLRGIDSAYIDHLAHLVDAKMRAVSAHGGTVDSLRVAVLASLNIADELECLRESYNLLAGSISLTQTCMQTRSASLSGMLDEVFDELDQMPIRRVG